MERRPNEGWTCDKQAKGGLDEATGHTLIMWMYSLGQPYHTISYQSGIRDEMDV